MRPVVISVSQATRPQILPQDLVEYRIGNLIRDFVRMTLGDGLRGE
jgi:hypothetical protein